MDRIRGMFGGGSDSFNDGSNNDHNNDSRYNRQGSNPNNHGWNSNSLNASNNNRYNYNKNGGNNINDSDMYLSDDDEWGMSALSATQTSLNARNAYNDHRYGNNMGRNEGGYGDDNNRRSSSSKIFWDQDTASSGGMGGINGDVGMIGGGGDGMGVAGMSTPSSEEYTQEWEREAILRDSLDDAFEIGNDDFYHSDQRSFDNQKSENNNSRAYMDVQSDIRQMDPDNHGEEEEGEVDEEEKEEVVNAYRDYLKSIREGGFESYLNEEEEDDIPDFEELARNDEIPKSSGNLNNTKINNNVESMDNSNSRVMEIEEDNSGGYYGDLYGVHDLRNSRSPYAAWKAERARRAPLQFDEEGGGDDDGGASMNSWNKNDVNGITRGNRLTRGFSDLSQTKLYHYKLPCAQSRKLQRWLTIMMAVVALSIGLSVIVKNKKTPEDLPDMLSIPPKDDGTSVGSKQPQQQNEQMPHQNSPAPPDAIANALGTFDPVWYNRQSGWEGITFSDAVNFCASREERIPCPYEIYCIEGPGRPPFDGIRPNGEEWAATSNGPNQWVQVGDMFTCQRYTDSHDKKKPEWGITGVSLDHEHGAGGITQNILCCKDANHLGPVTDWGKQDAIDSADADNTSETSNSTQMNIEDQVNEKDASISGNVAIISDNINSQKREKAVIAAFQPIWFSTAHGWSGTSYEDAVGFCESYNHMVLCPFAAYCPNGPGNPPLPGSMVVALDGEEWVPANGPMNTWVQIGKLDGDDDTTCTLHHELLGERPAWGVDGSRRDVKHHIMCCMM